MNVYCDDEFCVLDIKIIWGSLTLTYFSTNWYYSKFCLWQLEKRISTKLLPSASKRKKIETRLARHHLHRLTALTDWMTDCFHSLVLGHPHHPLSRYNTCLKYVSLQLNVSQESFKPWLRHLYRLEEGYATTNTVSLEHWEAPLVWSFATTEWTTLTLTPHRCTPPQAGYLAWEDL